MEEEFVAKILTGPTGGTFKIYESEGRWLPRFPSLSAFPLRGAKRNLVEARDDDVWICSFPRAGLHWVWEIVRMLKSGSAVPETKIMEEFLIERQDFESLNKMESPRVFPTHLIFSHLPPSFKEKKCKIVHLVRDPRAVAVSYFRLFSEFSPESGMNFEGSWDDFLPMFLDNNVPFGGWFKMEQDWEKTIKENPDYPIYVMTYENLKLDTVSEIQKLAQFLDADTSLDFCSEVAESTAFKKLKGDKESVASGSFVSDWFKDGNYQLFRKGTTDDWKYVFTVAQHEEFMTKFKEEMKGTSIESILNCK